MSSVRGSLCCAVPQSTEQNITSEAFSINPLLYGRLKVRSCMPPQALWRSKYFILAIEFVDPLSRVQHYRRLTLVVV
jgi:hypothetical protein